MCSLELCGDHPGPYGPLNDEPDASDASPTRCLANAWDHCGPAHARGRSVGQYSTTLIDVFVAPKDDGSCSLFSFETNPDSPQSQPTGAHRPGRPGRGERLGDDGTRFVPARRETAVGPKVGSAASRMIFDHPLNQLGGLPPDLTSDGAAADHDGIAAFIAEAAQRPADKRANHQP